MPSNCQLGAGALSVVYISEIRVFTRQRGEMRTQVITLRQFVCEFAYGG